MENEYFGTLKAIVNKLEKNRGTNTDLYLDYLREDNKRLFEENRLLRDEIDYLRKQINQLNKKLDKTPKKRKYVKKNEQEKAFYKNYDNFRKSILERDGYCCQNCGSKYRLQVHHIKSRKQHPELIMDADNCITLCIVCHSQTENFFVT